MKKLISWALLLTMVMVVFAGCGKTEDTPNKDTENDPPATQDPVTPPAGGETPETGDKIMVVVAVMVLAMTGMVVLVSKKRAI